MEEKTIKVYHYDELTEEAKEKALNNFRENQDSYFLEENLNELLEKALKEEEIEILRPFNLRYSLSYCKGDGLSFTGYFKYKGLNFNLTLGNLSNYYCHSNTINIEMEDIEEEDFDGDLTEELFEIKRKEAEKIEEEFIEVFHKICGKLEEIGYEEIEYQNSEEVIKEHFEANDYRFRENGEVEW